MRRSSKLLVVSAKSLGTHFFEMDKNANVFMGIVENGYVEKDIVESI